MPIYCLLKKEDNDFYDFVDFAALKTHDNTWQFLKVLHFQLKVSNLTLSQALYRGIAGLGILSWSRIKMQS